VLKCKVVPVTFPSTTGRDQSVSKSVDFPGPGTIKSAGIALNGFDINFRNGDHNLGDFKINCTDNPSFTGLHVDFSVNLLLRDYSGNIDDPYGGTVDVLVIADVS
jgi:hypothetical protein